jgi:hypothetical protein
MMIPSRFLEAFGPPTPAKIYDTPAVVVVSPRLRRLRRLGSLALQAVMRNEPGENLEPCGAKAARPLPVSPPRR